MKSAVFALLLVVAGAFAFPQSDDPRPTLEERIKDVIERISTRIRDAGFDPLEIENVRFEHVYEPEVIELVAFLENLSFVGASKIDVNHIEFLPFINRLTFDVSLPGLEMSLGGAGVNAVFFQYSLDALLSGSFSVHGIRAAGEINFNIGLDGVTVRSITIDLYFGVPQSDLSLEINGKDLSGELNYILGVLIPNFLEESRNEINRGAETIVRFLIDNHYN
ncbi:unnamed protein product, partial [Brenthis ino]